MYYFRSSCIIKKQLKIATSILRLRGCILHGGLHVVNFGILSDGHKLGRTRRSHSVQISRALWVYFSEITIMGCFEWFIACGPGVFIALTQGSAQDYFSGGHY